MKKFAICMLSSCSIHKNNTIDEPRVERKSSFFDHLKLITLGVLEGLMEDQHKKHNGEASANKPVPRNPPE